MTNPYAPRDGDVLLAVDLQNDFCPGGALPVPRGDEVVAMINRLAPAFRCVVLTQDWHPPDHTSFASKHAGRQAFETIRLDYGEQVLWPDHCVQATAGAALHADLCVPQAQLVIRKGWHRDIDSYSAFYENDHRTRTGLTGYLHDRGLRRVFVCGLAFDFCVAWTALDAVHEGFAAIVIADACRAIDLDGSSAIARSRLVGAGVGLIDAAQLVA